MSDDAHLERLTAEDLGLPAGTRVPLRFTPGHTWTPLVVSFPHVGLAWPHDLRPKPQADFPRNADYEVHTLYRGIESLGVATVHAHFSRLVVDLNRADDDVPPQLVPDHPDPRPRQRPGSPGGAPPVAWDRPGRGVVWASAVTAGIGTVRVLQPPLPYAAFADRIAKFHTPYYRALETLLQRRRERFGYAVLLDAHSMPGSVAADLVLGTLDAASCADPVATTAFDALRGGLPDRQALLSVRRDDPYRGGEIVRTFGRPSDGMHALQLEVSRRLYMDERVYRVFRWPSDIPALGDSRAAAGGHGTVPAPNRRRGRELAELVRRVRSLVSTLAGLRGDAHLSPLAPTPSRPEA
ncbi:MAG: N-formylglutamate amidohydrolase [Myxococcota bacterium]